MLEKIIETKDRVLERRQGYSMFREREILRVILG